MNISYELLKDLANALDNAFISSWQSTAAWQIELEAALDHIKEQQIKEELGELNLDVYGQNAG